MPSIRFYAVAIGAQPGIYSTWEGEGGARAQVDCWPHATHKAFRTWEEADAFLRTELFDKLAMRSESQVTGDCEEADANVAGPSMGQELTPLLAARREAQEKYLRSLRMRSRDSEDVLMGEAMVVKTE